MKHFGLWHPETKGWVRDGEGNIFWTTSRAVAEAQLEISNPSPFVVKEFIESPAGPEQR